MAGAEWYDSGIGFAVPLSDILPQLDVMKSGQDLKPGILGISLKGTDMYSVPAVIAACPAKSPAREAGLQVGDTIVEVNGQPIQRQAQLRHALGPHVAGDTIQLVVQRGADKQRVTASITLTDHLEPYVRPALGILPMRAVAVAPADGAPANSPPPGVVVRCIVPNGAAAAAGLKQGDRIVGIDQHAVKDATSLREVIIRYDPGTQVTVNYVRGEQPAAVQLTLKPESTAMPDELPPAHPPVEPSQAQLPPVGTIDIQIPEVANKCVAYVPEQYNPALRYGLLVWLEDPGRFDKDELIKLWKPYCDQNDLILLAPRPADEKRWMSTEIEFVRKTMDDVVGRYAVDPNRIVLHGYLAGGAMAYHVAFGNRELCRGVAPVDAPLPMRVGVPETDPVQPLAVYSFSSRQSQIAEPIKAGEQKLKKQAFPLVVVTVPGPQRYMNADELARLVRWIDTLDRL